MIQRSSAYRLLSSVNPLLAVGLMAGLFYCAVHVSPAGEENVNSADRGVQEPRGMQRVYAADIPERVQIIGFLGRPLGEMIEVRDDWSDAPESKEGGMRFRVTEVNGRPIEAPVEFLPELVTRVNGRKPDPEPGEIWEMRGVETGGMFDLPAALWNEAGGIVQQRNGFAFVTKIVFVSLKRSTPQ